MENITLRVKIKLSAKVASTSEGISGYVMVNDDIIDKYVFTQSGDWEKEFDYDFKDGSYVIGFTVQGKSDRDTVVDNNNNIVDDTLVTFEHLEIDEIEITELFEREALFYDLQGNPVADVMKNIGFNGSYTFKFNIPFYEWLLSKV